MLRYLGIGERSLGDYPLPPHARANWEFLAVVEGELAPYVQDSEPVTLRKSCLWLFPPGVVHGWRGAPGCTAQVVVIHFNSIPSGVEHALTETKFLEVQLNAGERQQVLSLGTSLKQHYRNPTPFGELCAERALMDLCMLAVKGWEGRHRSTLAGPHWNKVAEAETWLRQHIPRAPSVADVAQAVGLSASQLRRIFWKIKRRSPQHVLDKIRFDKAMHLMAKSDAKLEQVAAECGFSNAANFCRAFKAFVGHTPSTWRREIYIKYRRPRPSDKADYLKHGHRSREL